jgi:hypothetical protein
MPLTLRALVVGIVLACGASSVQAAEPNQGLRLAWADEFLVVQAPQIPGEKIRIHYLEAFCRAGSTDRDWGETVIKHQTQLISSDPEGQRIVLRNTLADGLVVDHNITAREDEVVFELTAHNPTQQASAAHWAQPCIDVAAFTGRSQQDYLPSCFVLLEGRLTRLPTEPWATKARYIPGQVYCPRHVPRDDVNPRPLSDLVPSHGLIGCFSADGQWVLASAWEPYQELFQGVRVCIHSDFRLGGVEPGETKRVRGKLYLVRDRVEAVVKRYERDFPEQLVEVDTQSSRP